MNDKQFFCRVCKGFCAFDTIKKGTFSEKTGKGKCKPCHNIYSKNRHMNKRAAHAPEDYLACDDCDRIMKDTHTVRCKFCNSENIEWLM